MASKRQGRGRGSFEGQVGDTPPRLDCEQVALDGLAERERSWRGQGRRGFEEFRGARGAFEVVRDATPGEFGAFKGLSVGRIDTDLGDLCPSEMTVALTEALSALPDTLVRIMPGTDPALIVDARILWYQGGGGIGAVLGKEALCIVRARLRSPQDDELADLRLVASSGAITRADTDDLAKALADALVKYLELRMPKRE